MKNYLSSKEVEKIMEMHELYIDSNRKCGIRAIFQNSFFKGISISDFNFREVIFDMISFVDCNLENISFSGAHYDNIEFINCKINNVNFIGDTFIDKK